MYEDKKSVCNTDKAGDQSGRTKSLLSLYDAAKLFTNKTEETQRNIYYLYV